MMNELTRNAQKPSVMIVDDNITNLTVARKALEADYNVILASSGKKALALLLRVTPMLILLGIDMPDMDGFETIRYIKANESVKDIPVIFLTTKHDTGSAIEGLRLGAADYIAKPLSAPLLLQRVELHMALIAQRRELQGLNDSFEKMAREQNETISELRYVVMRTLSDLIECRDGLTNAHVARTKKHLTLLLDGLTQSNYHHAQAQSRELP